MTKLLAWDPGLRESGAALFEDGKLTECMALYADTGRTGSSQWVAMANVVARRFKGVDRFVFETMSTRKGMEASHGNLIELSIISGLTAGLLRASVGAVPANTWTKGRKKHQNAAIAKELLDAEELAVLESALALTLKANHKEITDAVGIGLYTLKRWQ